LGEHNRALRAARERMPSRNTPGEYTTRAELAEAVNQYLWETTGRRFDLDDHLIGKWERGVVRYPIREYRAALRAVLAADTDAELGFYPPAHRAVLAAPAVVVDEGDGADVPRTAGLGDDDEMNRRELLRLFSMTGAALALPPLADPTDSVDLVDADRMAAVAAGDSAPDAAVVDDFARLNAHLWEVYGLTPQKKSLLSLVRDQLGVLCDALSRAPARERPHLCRLVSELYQLTGEVFFDADQYADAAQCYLLASTAAQEANAYDLWAAAMTRHAFVPIYGQQPNKAMPMLDLAAGLAHRGDSALPTRHWVAAVRAEVSAGIGDGHQCERDLATAADVVHLTSAPQRAGWLRFDGSRMPEQRGTCMVALGRLDDAESALTDALSQASTTRRRAGVLTDLALLSARRGDHRAVVARLDETISAARATESAFITRKLHAARAELKPLLRNPHIRRVDDEIGQLGSSRNPAGTR
jgi:tetratricopeptide (TPR) repeat protein